MNLLIHCLSSEIYLGLEIQKKQNRPVFYWAVLFFYKKINLEANINPGSNRVNQRSFILIK